MTDESYLAEIRRIRERLAQLDRLVDEAAWFREEDLTPEFQERHLESVLRAMAENRILRAGQRPPTGASVVRPPKPFTDAQLAAMTPEQYAEVRDQVHAQLASTPKEGSE
jgi:hypothetical protein